MSTMTCSSRLMFLALVLPLVAAGELPGEGDAKHMGVATCAASQCHGSAVPSDVSNVLQNEYVTWTQDDPHSRAYETLNTPESMRMAELLGLGPARTADACLTCHADNVPAARRGEKFQLSDGVGCEACHGGSEDWLASHYNVTDVTHADNLEAGLYPTENAADRAGLCLSCHLGNDNKLATHEMMAAGHPRLAFELDTFTELWRTAGRQPHYRVDEDYRERKGEEAHAYTWAVGVLVEARQRIDLIDGPRFAANGLFPELSLYDCHACHQSMKSVNWQRLPRHGAADPGQPFLNDGAFVMALALARAVAPGEAERLELALGAMHASAGDNVDAVRRAARDLDAVLVRVQSAVRPASLREQRLLEAVLTTGAEGNYSDYVSAEQAFMAVQMLAFEIGDAGLESELDALADSLADDERYRPAEFRRLLERLRGE